MHEPIGHALQEESDIARLPRILALLALTLVSHQPLATASENTKYDVTGAWEFHTDIGGREGTAQFVFKQQGSKLSGKYQGQQDETYISGTVEGDKIEFRVPTFGGKAVYKGTIGDRKRPATP